MTARDQATAALSDRESLDQCSARIQQIDARLDRIIELVIPLLDDDLAAKVKALRS